MFKQTTILTILALAASATAADITIPAQTGSVTGASTTVGPIVLTDSPKYSITVPFNLKIGTGTALAGFASNISVATNDNPGCTKLSGITTTAAVRFTLPAAVTTAYNVACVGTISLDCPSISGLTDGFEVSMVHDMTSLTPPYANVDLKLSDLAPAAYGQALKFMGTDVTFTLMLQNFTTFKKGMEVPLSVNVAIIKPALMEFPTALCGNYGKLMCGAAGDGSGTCVSTSTTGTVSCNACSVLCVAMRAMVNAAAGQSTHIYDTTKDVLGVFKTIATAASVTLPSQISTCKGASTYECISVGSTADQCPAGSHYGSGGSSAAPSSGAAAIAQHTATLLAVAAIIAHNLW